MREITIKPGEVVTMGFQGETGATQIRFDVSGWAEEYGEGVFQLVVRAPGSADAYTAAIAQEGDFVLWTVMAEDTAVAGSGYCQLEYYVDTTLAKSCGFRTLIAWSVGPSSGYASDAEAWAIGERGGDPVPETDVTYHNNARYYAGEAEASAERAATASDSALETVQAAGTEQVQRVRDAGETQIQAVAQEGAARQAAVVDEGSTQVQRVQTAGAAAAESTAEDIQTAGAAQIQSIYSAAADQLQAIGDMGAVQKAAVVDEGSTQVQRIQTVGAQTSDAIGDMVEIAEAAQAAATQGATDAETAKDAAAQSAAEAETSRGQAAQSATEAAGSATQAAGSADAAAASAAAAQTAAERDVPAAAAAWLSEHVDPSTGYVLDDSLTIQGAAADAKKTGDELTDLKNELSDFNCVNFLHRGASKTFGGITWAWNSDGSCTVSGTNTGSATVLNELLGSVGMPVMPQGMTPGKTYKVGYSSTNVMLRISIFNGSANIGTISTYENVDVDIPVNATGLVAFLRVAPGKVVGTETVKPIMYSTETNAELSERVADLLTLKPISKTAVSSGDDLNTYLTPGQWRIPTTAIARSLKNKPTALDTTGALIISNTHNDNHVYQTIYTNGFTGAWMRHIRIDEGIFDEWKSLVSDNGGYVWQEFQFLLHAPSEETADMQTVFDEYLNQTITDTHWWATVVNGFRSVSSDVIYSLWDQLQQECPEYIDAGEVIGYSLDPNGENYQPVKAYYIHPRLVDGRNTQIPYNSLPTVYLTAGTHGVEASPTWNLFAMFRRAFMTGTIYSAFLDGIQFRVIPCLSRWSYDHYKRYLAAAYNADGTQKVSDDDLPLYDANRMCICSGSTPSYNTLQIPSYAGEATALTSYLEAHHFATNPKDVYIDLHNCSYSLGYMTSDNLPIRYAFNTMMDTLAKDWLKNATYSNGDPVDYYNTSTSDHFALRGKILGHESIENSYAWYFEKAYSPYSSNILEVQAYDSSDSLSSCSHYALAKGLDITYRWIKYICDHIRG